MRRHVEPSGLRGEAERLQQVVAECALRGHVVIAVQHAVVEPHPRPGDALQQIHQWRTQRIQDAAQLRRRHPRLELVQQRVVTGVLETQAVRLLAGELQRVFQVGAEDREVGLGARLHPSSVVHAALARHRPDQVPRQPGGAVVAAAQFTHQRTVQFGQVGTRLGGAYQVAHLRGGAVVRAPRPPAEQADRRVRRSRRAACRSPGPTAAAPPRVPAGESRGQAA